MSVFSDTADQIVSVLRDSGRFGSIVIRADRQRDLETEIDKVINQDTGNLILVTWSGSQRGDKAASGPRFTGTFSITLWSKPLITDDEEIPADDYVQLICQLLDDHRPTINGREVHMNDRWVVMGAALFDHPQLLVHRIPVQIPLQLPKL